MTRKIKPPVNLYSALADATRCRIIELLLEGPIPVHRLADGFAISRPAISRHLRVLKTAGVVAEVKKGRENLYALRIEKLEKAIAWIHGLSVSKPTNSLVEQKKPSLQPAIDQAAPAQAPTKPVAPLAEVITPEAAQKTVTPKKPVPISQMGFDF